MGIITFKDIPNPRDPGCPTPPNIAELPFKDQKLLWAIKRMPEADGCENILFKTESDTAGNPTITSIIRLEPNKKNPNPFSRGEENLFIEQINKTAGGDSLNDPQAFRRLKENAPNMYGEGSFEKHIQLKANLARAKMAEKNDQLAPEERYALLRLALVNDQPLSKSELGLVLQGVEHECVEIGYTPTHTFAHLKMKTEEATDNTLSRWAHRSRVEVAQLLNRYAPSLFPDFTGPETLFPNTLFEAGRHVKNHVMDLEKHVYGRINSPQHEDLYPERPRTYRLAAADLDPRVRETEEEYNTAIITAKQSFLEVALKRGASPTQQNDGPVIGTGGMPNAPALETPDQSNYLKKQQRL
jgi:hypothetical protein